MKVSQETTTTRVVTLELYTEHIERMLRKTQPDLFSPIAPTVIVHFKVPGGGDWSNVELDVSKDNPLTVSLHYPVVRDTKNYDL